MEVPNEKVNFKLTKLIILMLLFLISSVSFIAQTKPKFNLSKGPTLLLNGAADEQIGAKYIYEDVEFSSDGMLIDAIVTIVDKVNVQEPNANSFIVDSSLGVDDRFEPTVNTGAGDGYVEWKVEFVLANTVTDANDTGTPARLDEFTIEAIDVDGSEYFEIMVTGSYTLEGPGATKPTDLVVSQNGSWTRFQSDADFAAGISVANTEFIVSVDFTNVNSISFRNGSSNDSSNRQNSISFLGEVTFQDPNVVVVNNPPVVIDNLGNIIQINDVFNVNVLVGSSDPDDPDTTLDIDPSTVMLIDPSDPANQGDLSNPLVISGVGTYTVDNTGNVTFTPVNGYVGDASINFIVKDDLGVNSNLGNLQIFINDIPSAVTDSSNVSEDSRDNVIDVLDNDSFGNDGSNVGSISLPTLITPKGTVSLDDGGTPNDPTDDTVLYTPNMGETGGDSFTYTITDSNGDTSTATVNITITQVANCNESPLAPAQGFNVFVENNLDVTATETRGAVAVGENLTIKGDYNVASDDCGDFDTNSLKTGLLVGGRVNYPLNTVINTTDDQCNCGDPTIVNNGSFEQNVNTNTWTQKLESDIPGWYTTATDNRIEIWKSGFLGKNAQTGNYLAEINATQRAALYQVICAEPGSVLNWSIWHRGRRGVDVADVKVGVSLNSAATVETMSTDQDAWKNYTGSYTVPAGEHTVYFVFQAVSSQPYNNLSYGNLIDNFQVTKTTAGVCAPGGANPSGLLTVVNPNYYTKIGDSNGSVAWYFDEQNAPANMRVTPNGTYNSSSRIQMNNNSPSYGVSSSVNPVYESNLLDFTSAFQGLRSNSLNMASYSDNVQLRDAMGTPIPNTGLPSDIQIDLQNGVNYLNLTSTDLNNVNTITFNQQPDATKTLIINVDAQGTFNWDVWEQLGISATESPYIMYNFYNSTEININGSQTIYGTILSSFASLNKIVNKADIYGQVIAKSFVHDGGVIHCNKFAATTTCPTYAGVIPTPGFDINVNPQCFVANDFDFTNTTNTGGVSQPDAPITYLWDFGDGTTSTSMDVNKFYATSGTYSVTLTSTNKYGSNSITQQVIVLPVLEPIVSVTSAITSDGNIEKTFTIDNAASFTDFSWNIPGSGPGVFQNQNPITVKFKQAGIYTISLTATSNDCTITIDIPVTILSDEVSGGNGGGVESESLGDAISKIYVGRKKNSVPTNFIKSEKNLYNKAKMKSSQPYQGKGQTMLDMFPTDLVAGNVANVTSPTDILDYTVADEVFSVDFSLDGKTKGVVLGIKTSDKIYNHTKASCDRLRGAEILNIQTVQLDGYNFLMQGIKQRNGVVEYAISFATAKNNNDANYTIQTNWYVSHYTKFNDVYNFQVWSTNPEDTKKLVQDILNNLKSYIPVAQTEVQKIPKTYAAKISRDRSDLVVLLRSTEMGQTVEVSMEEIYSETANNVKHRYNPINTQLEQELRIDIADGYEYDGLVKVNGEVEDAFYHADGNWGLDFDKNYTKIKNYFVSNNFDKEYKDGEHSINRNVELQATSDYDYLTLYKSLLPGTLSANYSEYKYVSFKAKGSGLMELGLIKSSIEEWKEQYRVMVDFSEEEQTYYVPFEIFTSTATENIINADDLTTLTFTFLPVEAQTTNLDLTISDVKFTKTAVEEYVVGKIEKFENEFMTYPNPSDGNIKVTLFSEIDSKATVTLTDITGKTIYSAPTELYRGKNELDFNFKVKPGVMFLKISSKENNYGVTKIMFR